MVELDFFFAYLLTISIESAALFLILRGRYGALLILRNSILASSLTLPFVWFFFTTLGLPWGVQTALSEIFAAAVEGAIYTALFKKLGMRDALLASVACNWISFIIGLAAAS